MSTYELPRSRQYAAGEYSRSLDAYFKAIYHCINNATCMSFIRSQITLHLFGISLDAAKRGSQCRAQLVLSCKIAIVGAMETSMMPDSFQRVEFGRVGGKVEDFHMFAMI